jgi:hypothetical protein
MSTHLCESLTDKMPLVAHGQLTWTEAEAAHFAECRDCRAEWQLIQTARDLRAAPVDETRLADAVLAGVARRTRLARWRRNGWLTGLAAAAAVALVVWRGGADRTGQSVTHGVDSSPALATEAGFHLPLAELEGLDAEQLQSVLEGLDAPVGREGPGGVPSMGELDDHQLERVLRSLEG